MGNDFCVLIMHGKKDDLEKKKLDFLLYKKNSRMIKHL